MRHFVLHKLIEFLSLINPYQLQTPQQVEAFYAQKCKINESNNSNTARVAILEKPFPF